MTNPEKPRHIDKAGRLVQYLLRLASLRTKLIRDVSDYEKVLWVSNVPHDRGCFTQAWGRDEEHEPDEWLEVRNRREPALPAVPAQCKDWVNLPSLQNKNDLPELLSEIIRQIPNPDWDLGSDQPKTLPHTERLGEHPEVRRAWDRYVESKWLPWTEEHHAWEKVHKVYSALFAIHQEQLRLGEEYELVLGLGLLTWQTPTGQRVRRHLLVADAILEFEARLGKFTVRPHTEGAKLRPELDMLDIEEQPARAEETAKASLAKSEDDPWEKDCVEGVLQALVHSINSQGDYDESLESKITRASAKPIVEYAPAFILRKRSSRGLTETLKRIKEQIEDGGEIPGEFADLAEIRPKGDREPSDRPKEVNTAFDGEVFFPKPSNDEQRRIVDKIHSSSGVLVQGPPGTGKSHTIANLICHLLATGKRILVTAKTPRALQVLLGKPGDVEQESGRDRGLIDKEIRPLCISLLGSGIEERKSLEFSANGILRKNDEWSDLFAMGERTELEERWVKLREEKAKVNRRLRDIRESETHPQSIAGGAYRGTAARIAEAVERDRTVFDWFMDSVPISGACPASFGDLPGVLERLRRFTPEIREELGLWWPESLPPPEAFTELVNREADAIVTEKNAAVEGDERIAGIASNFIPLSILSTRDLLSNMRDTRRRFISESAPWTVEATNDVLRGHSSFWRELLKATRNTISSVEQSVVKADEDRIDFPENVTLEMLRDDARKLKEHMESGGKLGWGWFRPKLVKERLYVIESVRVGGRPCSTAEHFRTVEEAITIRIAFEKIWEYWKGRRAREEGPFALQLTTLRSLRDSLEGILSLEELVGKCREALRSFKTIGEPIWSDEAQVEKVFFGLHLAYVRAHRRNVSRDLKIIEESVSSVNTINTAHPITTKLLTAIRGRDTQAFAQGCESIKNLENQRRELFDLEDNLSQLRRQFPDLANRLESTPNDSCWEERIQRIGDAWHWAQARYWVEDYIRKEDSPALAERAKQIEVEIHGDEEKGVSGVIAKLASLRAWSFCFSRLREDHRRHMEAWQQSMRRLGKGTGKHAPRHRREAQRHLNECREAVPAWVMPLHRVWDTVSPAPGMFDVIIVDEASQCGPEALPLLYLGKKILIVGDDKQISPDAVGIPRDAARLLMEEFLYDFKFKDSFDVDVSLFDHGKLRSDTRRIALREHFRCMPEIIRFSNDLCYSDTPLIPLRQYGPNRLPPLEHVFVSGGYREGSKNRTINRPEAKAIVERIAEMCGDRRYDDKTMGVVVLQGEAQAALIETQLLERLRGEEIERRRLICGNPYSFQGDERDIMLLSLVAASNERIGPLAKQADERRFNVAASRARDQMILFHSVTCDDLSASCLRRRLLDFFENPKPQQIAGIDRDELERRAAQDNRGIVKPPPPFDSWFEVDVALEIKRKGYDVIPQFPIETRPTYRIDLVIEGGQARLAIECDGDHWHGPDRYEADMERQRQLERCGWEFFRVRESLFRANREMALEKLWPKLEERGIFPNFGPKNVKTPPDDTTEEPAKPNPSPPHDLFACDFFDRVTTPRENNASGETVCSVSPESSIQSQPQTTFTSQEESNDSPGVVKVGSTVLYFNESEGRECQAQITYGKSDPDLLGTINAKTPLAQALLNAKIGDVVVAHLPNGSTRLRIMDIL